MSMSTGIPHKGLHVKTETLRVERVVCRLAREVTIESRRQTPADAREAVGVAVDVLAPSWDVFRGSALASATVMVWVYCLTERGLVRALSWAEDLRVLVEDAALRPGMRVEARLRAEPQEALIVEGYPAAPETQAEPHAAAATHGRSQQIVVLAAVHIEALVLETKVLPVVVCVEAVEPVEPVEPARLIEGVGAVGDEGVEATPRRGGWARRVLEGLRSCAKWRAARV
ncbi:MAG: hypothetical protein ACM3X3_05850 [Betaproteobacteria bacterium]